MGKKLASPSISWLFVGAMFVLCGVLGALQYRWIGQVSVAERVQLRQRLQADLNRLSQDFNSELTSACRTLAPTVSASDVEVSPEDLAARYAQWKKSTRHPQLFHSIALAVPKDDHTTLHMVDLSSGVIHDAPWPAGWNGLQSRIEARLASRGSSREGREWPRGTPSSRTPLDAYLVEVPIFPPRGGPGPGHREQFGRAEAGWLIVELDTRYVGENLLPEIIQRDIGAAGRALDYQVDVVSRTTPPSVIYQSSATAARDIDNHPDASVGLFDIQMDQFFRRPEPPGMRDAANNGPPNFRPGPDMSRWQMNVRHRAGSLEAVVATTRLRSLAVTGAILLLLIASAGALLRYTRRAQRLARLQMDFVAGISHELRTPLAVIYGAAYNLRGAVAGNPNQVERYGVLLQQESGRLRDLVEQVLRFSGAQAGSVIREREPVAVDTLIDQTLDSTRSVVQGAGCVVEKDIDPKLPLVLADPLALKHALQNLVTNAAKYGQRSDGDHWIGISASRADSKRDFIEIRVADHGPGIPSDEQAHVFDAFFRGRRAIQDQIHGTGLGLNLVSKIVEAHGGSIRVESEPMKQTEFIVRLPAAVGIPESAGELEPAPQPAGGKR